MSHIQLYRGSNSAELAVITSIKGDEQYWDKFFDLLPDVLHGADVVYVLVLESPSLEQLSRIQELTSSVENIMIISVTGSSVYAAWNLAISVSDSRFISNLNIDELRLPGSYVEQVKLLRLHPQNSGLFGKFAWITDWSTADLSKAGDAVSLEALSVKTLVLRGQNPMHASPIWKRELHKTLGLFDERYLSSADTNLWLSALLDDHEFLEDKELRYLSLRRSDSVSSPANMVGVLEWGQILQEHSKRIRKALIARP